MPSSLAVVTTAWVPPAFITGFSGTAEETQSYIMLNWDVSTLSAADFSHYSIYRRVMGADLWSELVQISDKNINVYKDNTAGQTIQYEYIITQFKAITGDVPLESAESDTVSIALATDAWFTIMLQSGGYEALEVNVTDEDHSSVIQQEVFEPIASLRKRVVRGNVMGDEGSFTCLFDTVDAGLARQHFSTMSENKGPHILKSPFGDVWFVEFDAPGFKYRTGGHLEIKIGWVEV